MVLATAADKVKQDVKKSISIVTLLTNILLPTEKRITEICTQGEAVPAHIFTYPQSGVKGSPLAHLLACKV